MLNKDQSKEMVQQVLPLAMIRGEALIEQPKDLFIPPDALAIILEQFEGPLDLLLYLIRKQKFDILDLPIAPIAEQYRVYVELMTNVNLELAAEYLVMGAILAEIKSRLLLPKQVLEESEEDPRAELIRRLQEYEVIKYAAIELDNIPRIERDNHLTEVALANNFMPRTATTDLDITDLIRAFNEVMQRTAAVEHYHIQRQVLSTRERMAMVLTQLTQASKYQPFIEFSQLFNANEGKSGVVVTFLAILELIKASLIECIQADVYGQLQVKLTRACQ